MDKLTEEVINVTQNKSRPVHHFLASHTGVFFIREEEIQIRICTRNTCLGEIQLVIIYSLEDISKKFLANFSYESYQMSWFTASISDSV